MKRKRGSAEAAEVLFLQEKTRKKKTKNEKETTRGTDTDMGRKRRIKKNRYTTSNDRSAIKNDENDDFVKGRYDRELAAQLDAVLGGGVKRCLFIEILIGRQKTKEGEGDFDEDEKKTKKKSNGMLKKFVRLTREAGMETKRREMRRR